MNAQDSSRSIPKPKRLSWQKAEATNAKAELESATGASTEFEIIILNVSNLDSIKKVVDLLAVPFGAPVK